MPADPAVERIADDARRAHREKNGVSDGCGLGADYAALIAVLAAAGPEVAREWFALACERAASA